jgi:PAS domain S-box-containing protein
MNEFNEQGGLDGFFDLALDLLTVSDRDGYLLRVNKAWERCLGIPADAIEGTHFLDYVHPDDAQGSQEQVEKIQAQNPLPNFVNRLRMADGSYRFIQWQSQPVGNLIYSIGRDITEARLAEQRLAESERHFRFLFEQSTDAVFMLDFAGRPIFANQQAKIMLGYSEEEFKNLTVETLSAELDKSQNVLERLMAGEKVLPYECHLRHKDGSPIPAEITIELVRDEQGNPLHHQSIMRDIRRRKKAERQAIELQLEKERSQSLSNFIQGTSHEFRTPLSIIKLNSYLMKRLDDPAKRAEKSAAIDIQIQRIVDLLTMLNKMRQLDGSVTMKFRACELRLVMERIILNMQTEIAPKHLSILMELDDTKVLGDEEHLWDAFWQILRNAVQASHEGGEIRIGSFRQETQLCLFIEDKGIGMTEDVLARIFERFFRLDDAHSTAGFGLGLPLAQSIIQQHQGDILVTSKFGEGTRVEVYLPLAPDEDESSSSA